MQGLVNIVDDVEETSLNWVFFPTLFLLNVALHYLWEARVERAFFFVFHAYFETVERISLHWLSACGSETPKDTTVIIPLYI